jgi:hypothetical protein
MCSTRKANGSRWADYSIPVWERQVPAGIPLWTFRDGLHVFKVSLWRGLWRRIGVPRDLPLDALAHAVLDAYEFDCDHLYRFSYRNQFGVEEQINHPFLEEGQRTDKARIGDVPVPVGQTMSYAFDLGDWWEFEVMLERVEPPKASIDGPVLLGGQGDAPQQYPDWDEE